MLPPEAAVAQTLGLMGERMHHESLMPYQSMLANASYQAMASAMTDYSSRAQFGQVSLDRGIGNSPLSDLGAQLRTDNPIKYEQNNRHQEIVVPALMGCGYNNCQD
jgi:hypothetical protein